MFIKFFLTNFIIFYLTSISYGEIINSIKVKGNKRLSPQTITIFADVVIGDDYNQDELNDVLKRLYQTDFLKTIDLEIINNILEINVVENPIIENIDVNGVKNEKLKEAIIDNFNLKNRQSYSESKFSNDRIQIVSFLKRLGYYFSTVETSLTKNDELNSIILTYDIELGDKAKISEIKFIGNKYFKDRKLNSIITSEESRFWKFISSNTYLDSSRIDLDKRLLMNYFKNSGFYNVKILDSFVETKDDASFKLIFNIDSGEKFYFNKVSIVLPDDFDSKYFKSIRKKSAKLVNKKYSLARISKILDEVDKIALSKQFEFIDAVIEETIINNNKIDFTISMKESEKFYIERINILGNQYTKEEVIRNKLIADEGDPYNELLFNKSINALKSKNIFKTVEKQVKSGSNPGLKEINILVEEKPTGEISMGAGVGTAGGTIGGGLRENNFMGSGITLNTNLALTKNSVKGEFSVIKPNYNYSDNTLFASVKSSSVDKLSDSGYESSNNEISVGTKFLQYENLYIRPDLAVSNEKLTTTSAASAVKKKQSGNYFDLNLNYKVDYDLRNSPFQTSEGYQIRFYQELPLISETSEVINTVDMARYYSLTNDIVGKVSLYGSAAQSISGDDVRLSKRLYLPGRKLRGFESGKIGPKEKGDFIGGNYATALNFTASLPKLLAELQNTDVTLFFDIANLWGVDYDKSLKDSNQLRSAAGVAVDVLTIVGPMTFSLSQPITKMSSDVTETFRFNIGTTF